MANTTQYTKDKPKDLGDGTFGYTEGDYNYSMTKDGKIISRINLKTHDYDSYDKGVILKYDKSNKFLGRDVDVPSLTGEALKNSKEYKSYEKFVKLLDENPELGKSIAAKVKADNPKKYGSMDDKHIIDILKQGQLDNAKIQTAYANNPDFLKHVDWDKTTSIGGKNKIYNAVAKKLEINPMSEPDVELFQNAYGSSYDIINGNEGYKEKFTKAGFQLNPVGKADDNWKGQTNISKADSIYGNTTVGQLWKLKDDYKEPVATTEPVEEPIDEQEDLQPGVKPGPDTWYLPDMINFAGALGTKIGKFMPSQSKVAFQTPGYTTIDDARTIADIQENTNKIVDIGVNTGVGVAGLIGIANQSNDKIANIRANTEMQNAQIVNSAAVQNAGMKNTEAQYNDAARQTYLSGLARTAQNYLNAKNTKNELIRRAHNQGWENMSKKNKLATLFPQVRESSMDGSLMWSGVGRNPLEPDTYVNMFAQGTDRNKQVSPDEMFNQAFAWEKKRKDFYIANGIPEEDAAKKAKTEANTLLGQSGVKKNSTASNYFNAYNNDTPSYNALGYEPE